MKDWRYAALDLETTGLEVSEGHEILEVAVVGFSAAGIEERWSTLVKPTIPIPPDSARVHGIREADVAGAPALAQVMPLVEARTAGRIFVIHNAPFDLEFLTAACARMGREPIDRPLIDTLTVSRRVFPEAQAHSLTELATRVGVVPEGAHRALPDAVTTANVMLALLRRAEAPGATPLLDEAAVARIERRLAEAAAPAAG
ncbi:MAG: 3'-5' exonuclease [Candidatus Eisenbacteria bacterium]|nr:3'-5' exonuclease [Candidatus Eisenbacteria bacterium]